MKITLGTVTCGLCIWGNAGSGLVRDLSAFRDGGSAAYSNDYAAPGTESGQTTALMAKAFP